LKKIAASRILTSLLLAKHLAQNYPDEALRSEVLRMLNDVQNRSE
jgi:hypothetical protein